MSGARATLSVVGAVLVDAARATRPRGGDLAVAAVALAAAVVGTVSEILEAPRPAPSLTGGVVFAVLAGVALLWRRFPVACSAAVVALCLLYHGLGYPGLAPAVVLFATLYAVTSRGSGGRSVLVAAALVVGISVVPLLPPHPAGFGWSIVGPAVGLVAAAALGEAARARRVAIEEQLRAVRGHAEEEAHRRAVQDRVEVARDVHDVLAHTLTVIAVQAAAATEALDDRPEEARAALTAVRGAAREALTELRATVSLLRGGAPTAPEAGLAQLQHLRELAAPAGLAVTLTVTGERPVPVAVERTVYRIVQEALTNTIRHADASTAAVTVDLGADAVTVEVTDDGSAAEGRISGRRGQGLVGMRERALALGGSLEAGPAAGQGFRVAARLPAAAP